MEDELRHISGPLFREIQLKGRRYLYFGGTAYLGIPQHAAFYALYAEGLQRYGLNNGTSRNNNIQLGIYDQAEAAAAQRFGAQAALITSSGWLAAQLTLKQVCRLGIVRYAPDTHPALWTGGKPATEGGFSTWAQALVEEINQSAEEKWVIISNSLNNLFPEVFDFAFLEQINPGKQIVLVVDDSHGIGIMQDGKGVFATLPSSAYIEPIVVSSMAKALGVDAGLVLGRSPLINQLKQTPAFLGASPPAAAGLYAFMQSETIYEHERQKLLRLTSAFAAALGKTSGWQFKPDFPVFLSANEHLAASLMEQGFLISSFPYPDKNGPALNRIVLNSWHTDTDIEELILALSRIN